MTMTMIGTCSQCDGPVTAKDAQRDKNGDIELVDGNPVHGSCYYDALSNAIDEHGIGLPINPRLR